MKTTNALLVVLILCVVGHGVFIFHAEGVRESARIERARQRAALIVEADENYSKQNNYVSHRMQEAIDGKLPFTTEQEEAMLLRSVLQRMDARQAALEKFPL